MDMDVISKSDGGSRLILQQSGSQFAEYILGSILSPSEALTSYVFSAIIPFFVTEGAFYNKMFEWAHVESKKPRAYMVMKGTNIFLSERLHEYVETLQKSDTYKDLVCDLYIANIGKSSFVTKAEWHFKDTNKSDILACYEELGILIDPLDRKPKELPGHIVGPIIDDVKGHAYNDFDLVSIDKAQALDMVEMEYTVESTDIDLNRHTTLSSYIFLANMCYFKIQGEEKRLKNIQVGCLGETFLGDILHVKCWLDKTDPGRVNCVIERGTREVFLCQMEHFLSPTSKR